MAIVTDFIFLGYKITADGDCSYEIKRHLFLGRKARVNLDSILKSRDITLPTKVCIISYGFSSGHVWVWELDYKECWGSVNWCFWTFLLEKILESSLDCKEIKLVSPKGNQSWIFIGTTDAEVFPWDLKESDMTEWLKNNRRTRGFDPWVRKIPQEEGLATHSSILAWRIPSTEASGGTWSIKSQCPTRLKWLGMRMKVTTSNF